MAMRWYSVSVLSNYEKKVMASINESIEQFDLSDQIEQVLVPTEEVVEVRRGKKVQTERRFMPGYVLVRMEMTDKAYHMISVPCILPSIKLIAIALKNMPVMIHTMSISTIPLCRSSRPAVSGTTGQVL